MFSPKVVGKCLATQKISIDLLKKMKKLLGAFFIFPSKLGRRKSFNNWWAF